MFSTTSLQTDTIRPQTPRAIYFNDDVYVAYVQDGPIEIAALDPSLGTVFYSLEQRPAAAELAAELGRCLSCHDSYSLTGGGVPSGFDQGFYYEPTVIAGVEQDWEIVQNEVFGPVVTVQEFEDEKDALTKGNDVLYGLAASVFTKDIGRAMRISSELEFGTVWINDHLPLTSETPHGGFKQSGFGKDLSAEAIGDYQITKHVMIAQA